MLQEKIAKLFSGMPNAFGIADDILMVDFDECGEDYGKTLEKV